jgi:phosphatidylserine/phosphatidylglycerophosphate/cardiolipin synthase-like enzyme
VKVTVVLDNSQRSKKYSSPDFVAHTGIPTYIDAMHAIAHNKIMIIDWAVVTTGSFNFTKAAEKKNTENILVISGDAGLVKITSRTSRSTWGNRRSARGDKSDCQISAPTVTETGEDRRYGLQTATARAV